MNQVALDYLLRLAALSMAFVGFATIVVTLRRSLGTDLATLDFMLVRYYLESGLFVTFSALLPSLLSMAGLSATTTWRLCSAVVGIATPISLAIYIRWILRSQPEVLPRMIARSAITIVVVVGLWLNIAGVFFEPNGVPYAVALTWLLASAGIVFLQTLDDIIGHKPKG